MATTVVMDPTKPYTSDGLGRGTGGEGAEAGPRGVIPVAVGSFCSSWAKYMGYHKVQNRVYNGRQTDLVIVLP